MIACAPRRRGGAESTCRTFGGLTPGGCLGPCPPPSVISAGAPGTSKCLGLERTHEYLGSKGWTWGVGGFGGGTHSGKTLGF